MYRHSNDHLRQPSAPRNFDFERSNIAQAAYGERLPARPDPRHHHASPPDLARRHHHHPNQHGHHPMDGPGLGRPPIPEGRFHPSDHRSVSHPSASPASTSLKPPNHTNSLSTSLSSAPSAPSSSLKPNERNRMSAPADHLERASAVSHTHRAAPTSAGPGGSYDEPRRSGYANEPTEPSRGLSNRAYDDVNSSRESHPGRRLDDFPPRSNRYNPYPPSAPRADSHITPMPRIPNNASSVHGGYHSQSGGLPSSAYDDRINSGPRHHHEHHPPPRVFDPNSQFNHGPPKDKSPASQSVIFMGLPIHTDEAGLRAFLEETGASVESVTIIYDRVTGQSKRYGFARFASVDHARAFVEPAFPMIVWKEPSSSRCDRSGDGLKVKIDYSQKEKIPFEVRQRERELNRNGGEYQGTHSAESTASNDGARDIGGTPTSILLLRGLDAMTTEQEIAQHLCHIPDPSQTVLPDSIKKVMLIKDRVTRKSWGYAFVQFAEVQVAVKALSLLLNTSLFPRGFQIRSRTITVTFAHEHSFHPVYTPSDWSFKGASGQELAYWDDKAYAALYITADKRGRDEDPEKKENGSTSGTLKEKRKVEEKSMEERRKDPEEEEQRQPRNPSNPEAAEHEPSTESANPILKEKLAEKKKTIEPIATKKMVANIQKWKTKHEEIANPEKEVITSEALVSGTEDTRNEDDYSDLTRMTCLLCQRQFKSIDDLLRHNNLSNLHKGNLQNEKMVKAGKLRKAALIQKNGSKKPNGATPTAVAGGTSNNNASSNIQTEGNKKYQDRAAARRETYGQPDMPNLEQEREAKRARYEPAPAPVQPPSQPDKDGIQATNVGSKMLEKMGWQKGEGLGNGNGRVEPVIEKQYTKGVGLGANSSPGGQFDSGKKGFMEQVKEKTVERFNQD